MSEQLKVKDKLNKERIQFDQMVIENDKKDLAHEHKKKDLQK